MNGSSPVAEISETSKTRKGTGLARTTPPLKLQASITRLKLCLLERFIANPAQTRHEVRVKLGVLNALAAEVIALTVFLCEDLLQLRPTLITSSSNPAAVRFFAIAVKLPMELQMILCHRAVGSMKQNILRKDSEAAFKSLARILLLLDLQSE